MQQPQPAASFAPPRSKVELLYQQILHETDALLTRTESLLSRQEALHLALQSLPAAIQRAGVEAGNQAATHANRSLLDAARSSANATNELRAASRVAGSSIPAIAWRTGLMCAASAFFGSVLCAATVALLI